MDVVEREFPDIRILRLPTNQGFVAAVNRGIQEASSRYVALLNVDTRARPGWLESLVSCLQSVGTDFAAASSKLLRMDAPELIDDAGDLLSWYGSALKRGHLQPAGSYEHREEVFSVSAAGGLYRRDFLAEVGFDPVYESYFEDIDVGLRGRLVGHRFVFEPQAEVLHWGGGGGLRRGRYVTLVTRNRLLTITKSIPARLLLRHAHRLVWGQIYFLVAYRKPLWSLAGYAGFLRRLPHALSERRRLSKRRTLSVEAIDSQLTRELGEPPLRELVRRRWSKWSGTAADRERG